MTAAAGEVLTVIPARGGSKGIPRKNLVLLRGLPLIAHTIHAARDALRVTRVVVSTDDDEIAAVSREHGAETPFKRAADLAGDNIHAADVARDSILRLGEQGYAPDLVLMLLPTAPLRKSRHVDEAIALFGRSDALSVVGVRELGNYLAQMRTISDGYLRPLDASVAGGSGFGSVLNTQRNDVGTIYVPNGSIYAARPQTLVECGGFHLERTVPYLMSRISSIDIDEPADLELANALFDLV